MSNTAQDRIRSDIAENDVVLFMKGTPVFPQCGFSAAVVEILSELGVKFKGVNVLADAEIRQGIKEFSNWPTIPQLYVKGEFVGGCDIIREMFEADELAPFFAESGVVARKSLKSSYSTAEVARDTRMTSRTAATCSRSSPCARRAQQNCHRTVSTVRLGIARVTVSVHSLCSRVIRQGAIPWRPWR